MVDVPEHLLERTRARRAALGLPVSGGGSAEGAAATPAAPAGEAAAASAVPEVVAPAVAAALEKSAATGVALRDEPTPAVQAVLRRKRPPWWAVTLVVSLPFWGFFYANSLEKPEREPFLIAAGAEVFTSEGCAGCHGADGAGGSAGPPLTEVFETFPDPARQALWVRLGSEGWNSMFPGTPYGAQGRAVGETRPGRQMPAHPDLTSDELLEVIMYIRHGVNADTATITAEPAEEPSDTLEDFARVGFDEEGLPVVDPQNDFLPVEGEGDLLWQPTIESEGGDLPVE